jgi:uncharacterized protein (TIGR03435 family)
MKILLQVALPAFAVLSAQAQPAPGADLCAITAGRPAFDVVSIKPAQTAVNGWMRRSPDGLTFTGPLNTVIQYAYNVRKFQLTGGPDWLRTQDWEIRAKSDFPDPDLAELSDAQRQALWDNHMQELQSTLADRFHFKCHMAEKEMSVYDLVVAKGGSKLKDSTAEAGNRGNISVQVRGLSEHASGKGISMARIALLLSAPTGRVVLDKTGLTGSYDLALDWTNDAPAGTETSPEASGGASIYTAVEEQLGLKLEPARSAVPVMVIDSVERPGEN